MAIEELIRRVAAEAAEEVARRTAAQVIDAARKVGRESELPTYLTTEEAALYLGLSIQYLEIGRIKGHGPKYSRRMRVIRYRRSDLDEWMAERVVDPAA